MQVTIKNVDVEWNGAGAKKWGKAVVEYTFNGQARKQNVMSFGNTAEVFKKVQELTGQTVEVELVKNDKGFNEWKSVTVGLPDTGSVPNSGATAKNAYTPRDYETKEERAKRQVYIIKQSSLSAATALMTPGAKTALDPKAVIETAQLLTDWVLEQQPTDEEIGDIPF
jgi:hypothetical protein